MAAELTVRSDGTGIQTDLFRPRRFLVIDDHPIVSSALTQILHNLVPDAVIRATDTLASVLQLLASDPIPDLTVLDLNLPDTKGVESLEQLRSVFPDLPFVVFSGDEQPATVLRALEVGACGFLP